MSRLKLEIEDTYDFRLYGISCHEKDYRLVWGLNMFGGFKLIRKDDLALDRESVNNSPRFPFYEEVDEENFKIYQIVANRFGSSFFLNELSSIDYIFFARGEIDEIESKRILKRILKVDFILLASELQISKIKQKENLLFF